MTSDYLTACAHAAVPELKAIGFRVLTSADIAPEVYSVLDSSGIGGLSSYLLTRHLGLTSHFPAVFFNEHCARRIAGNDATALSMVYLIHELGHAVLTPWPFYSVADSDRLAALHCLSITDGLATAEANRKADHSVGWMRSTLAVADRFYAAGLGFYSAKDLIGRYCQPVAAASFWYAMSNQIEATRHKSILTLTAMPMPVEVVDLHCRMLGVDTSMSRPLGTLPMLRSTPQKTKNDSYADTADLDFVLERYAADRAAKEKYLSTADNDFADVYFDNGHELWC